MKVLVVLLGAFALSAALFRISTGDWQAVFSANLAMCLMLCFTALGHFLYTEGMAKMLPAWVPFRKAIVLVSGLAEPLLGFGLLVPGLRGSTGGCIIIMFALLLPANIYAALHRVHITKPGQPGPGPAYLWFRIPLQLFFIVWVAVSSCHAC